MITTRTNETLLDGLYHEWLSNLAMYQQELEYLEQLVTRNTNKDIELDASIELEALHELIEAQQKVIEGLTTEVLQKHEQLKVDHDLQEGVIPFSEVLKNNQLREKIRKAEHSVFYLKYHVNKLLSIAS